MSHQVDPGQASTTPPIASDEGRTAALTAIADAPLRKRLGLYVKMSGPGWLQSAITLGGGSLAGSLFLGVLVGVGMMWLQPLAIMLGIIMLMAISHVTLTTRKSPFKSINQHISPVLGWGWLIATLAANCIWCMPQFSLSVSAVQDSLFPSLKDQGWSIWVINALLFAGAIVVTFGYNRPGGATALFEAVLKVFVGIIVLCFFAVAGTVLMKGQTDFGALLAGFVPDLSMLFEPSDKLAAVMSSSDMSDAQQSYWSDYIVAQQRDTIIGAFAVAVGINMTFLLPYSQLKKNWGKVHRELAKFDLCTALFIPFIIATSCVVLAAADRFHGVPEPADVAAYTTAIQADNADALPGPLKTRYNDEALGTVTTDEIALAAALKSRNAGDLAGSLEEVLGPTLAQWVFGIGVLAMGWSTMIVLMLINGFVAGVALDKQDNEWVRRIGCLIPGVIGFFYPFIWDNPDLKFWLAIQASTLGMLLLPIAYAAFWLLINNRQVMGDQKPSGTTGVIANLAMGLATTVAILAAGYMLWHKGIDLGNKMGLGETVSGVMGVSLLVLFAVAAVVYKSRPDPEASAD